MPVLASPVSRVIIVVMDGLRADAVPLFELEAFRRLADRGCASLAALTVAPSVTAAAMASLLTGVPPQHHGLTGDRLHLPRARGPLDPLPRVVRRRAVPTFTFMARLPFGYRRLAARIARALGVEHAAFRGEDAASILDSAHRRLEAEDQGLFLLHWPDADRAGHASGWTSPDYRTAARHIDATLGRLDALVGASADPATLLIALADHGGGGHVARDHDSQHPHDRRIPLLLTGGQVVPGSLGPCSLLDVPATACWALGVPVPPSYEGRVLREAFGDASPPPVGVHHAGDQEWRALARGAAA